MKKKIWKPVVTGIGVLMTAVIVSTAVMNSAIEAEAADTFLGIQNLITEVSQEYEANQQKYTILEVVPDREASEIGYFFDGYEPALSSWDEEEMRWVSWREQLGDCIDEEERRELIEGDGTEGSGLKAKLQAYYDANRISKVPVTIARGEYQEADSEKDGYERIDFEQAEKNGWFVHQEPLGDGFQLIFVKSEYVADSGIMYYCISNRTMIDEDNKEDVDPDASIYAKRVNETGTYYEYVGIWDEIKEDITVSGGDVSGGDVVGILNNKNNAEAGSAKEEDTEGESEEDESLSVSSGDAISLDKQAPGEAEEEEEESGYYTVVFEKVEDIKALPEGEYVYIVDDTNIKRSKHAEYTFHEAEDGETGQLYTLGETTIYCKNTFTNNEWFRKYVLSMNEAEYGAFPVEVISYTPEELATAYAAGTFPDFDFLYINSGKSAGWTYSNAVEEDALKGGDITAEVGQALFTKVQSETLPCIIDGNIIFVQDDPYVSTSVVQNTDLFNRNIFKLCVLFCQEKLDAITLTFAGADTTTLWATLAEGSENGNFTTDHVYCHTGKNSIVNNDFSEYTIYRAGSDSPTGFQKVLDEIELENLYRQSDSSGAYVQLPTDISQATVVRHIMNYQNRRNAQAKEHINVLEIQPAKTQNGQPKLTLAKLQEWAPEVKSANITVMTTAEFIGKVETLNDKYDLIYIGTCKDYMNTQKGSQSGPDAQGSTVFNDATMNGLVYFHTGDKRYSSMELSGQLASDYVGSNVYYYTPVRYSGNDITYDKYKALVSYLNGSYPVVVSGEFFESPATVYEDSYYGGYSVDLDVGEYRLADLQALGINNDDITSIKVKDGYQVIGYWDDKFESESLVLTEDIDSLSKIVYPLDTSKNWNDKISAIKVEQISGSTPQRAIDEDHIDNSSYMYDFVKMALDENRTNFYSFDEIEADSQLFQFYLNRPKASLVNTSANGILQDNVYYIDATSGRSYLEYRFTIVNAGAASADTQYRCNFYIDINADGKYSSQEELGDVQLTSGGGGVSTSQLYAGREYVLRRVVPDGYKGVLPWKIQISQVNNPNIYCSMGGYTKLTGLEKETINILQICRDQVLEPNPDWWGHDSERFFSLAEQINGKKTEYVNLETDGEGNVTKSEAYSTDELVDGYQNNLYYILVYGGTYNGVTYPGISDEFDINVDFMTISKFEKDYLAKNIDMSEYNMLILGFADAYGDFSGDASNPESPLGAIVEFINSGKSVLMSHDNTSYFNYPKGAVGITDRTNGTTATDGQFYNAYTLNRYIRGLIGMDRYGIMQSSVLQSGTGLTAGNDSWNSMISLGKDIPYKAKSGKTETVPETQGYTYSIINAKDKMDPAVNEYYNYETGLETTWYNTYTNLNYGTVYYNDGFPEQPWVGISDNGEIPGNYDAAVHDLWVTQVNKGQITEYPYKLAERFPVTVTHGQYYQLDFTTDDDVDGQTDLVVWYCLGNRLSSSGTFQETVYSMSPNDVMNNYYIYNKGNITYTGMGHDGMTSATAVDEAKLFINTMVAAYSAGVKPPMISIKESGSVDSPDKTVLYRYYDNDFALDTADTTDSDEEIYFTLQDVNFVKGSRNLAVHVFYSAADGTQIIEVNGENKAVKELPRDGTIHNALDDTVVDPNNLQSGGIYYIKVPKSVLADCANGLQLYFEAQSFITTNGKTIATEKIYDTLDVLQTYLFDLN